MKYPCPDEENYTEPGNHYVFMVERERLLMNLDAARKISAKARKTLGALYRLRQEVEFRQAELRALKVKVGGIAVKYGLEPIHPKSK